MAQFEKEKKKSTLLGNEKKLNNLKITLNYFHE